MFTLNKQLKEYGHVRANVPLSKFSTFKIGGLAQFLVEVEKTDNLVRLLNFLTGEGNNFYILGGGSNVLFSDEGFEGVVVKIKTAGLSVNGETIEADAGVMLGLVLNSAVKNDLTGLEWSAGIPGTVGGAVRGNAGAMGKDVSCNISAVEIWSNGEITRLTKDECGFAYRESFFKQNSEQVILRAWFGLQKGDPKDILKEMQGYLTSRTGKFPKYPSAGSFFKNIEIDKWPGDKKLLPEIFVQRGKVPAAYTIDQAGLKGLGVGGAKMSDEHGNFLINFSNATQNDVLAVVEKVKEAVYNKFGVELEEEVEIIK